MYCVYVMCVCMRVCVPCVNGWRARLRVLYTNLAATYSGSKIARLQGLFFGTPELLAVLYGYHPEAVLIRIVMAVSFGAVALDKRCGAEVLQAGTGTRQGLATALGTCAGVLKRQKYSSDESIQAQFALFI